MEENEAIQSDREKRIIGILSFLSDEIIESDLLPQLYAELMAKSDEEFDQVCDRFTRVLITRYTPLRNMTPRQKEQ